MNEIEERGLAERANAEHRACETAVNAALDHAMRAGDLLLEVKTGLPHGAFGAWVEENFAGSGRTARAYMRVARHREELEAKRQRSATLSLDGALKALSAPKDGTPERDPGLARRLRDLEQQLADLVAGPPALPAFGRVLLEIDAEGLYKVAGYTSFSRYCSERLRLSCRSREAAILHAELVAVVPAFDTDERIAAILDGTTIENLVEAWKILDALEGVVRQRV